jgi:cobalamin synthase
MYRIAREFFFIFYILIVARLKDKFGGITGDNQNLL